MKPGYIVTSQCTKCFGVMTHEIRANHMVCMIMNGMALGLILAIATLGAWFYPAGVLKKTPPSEFLHGEIEVVKLVDNEDCYLTVTTQTRSFVIRIWDDNAARAAANLFEKGDRVRIKPDMIGDGSGPHDFYDMDGIDRLPREPKVEGEKKP